MQLNLLLCPTFSFYFDKNELLFYIIVLLHEVQMIFVMYNFK